MRTFKNIFSRSTSLWLSLELILVTIVCWWTFAPVLENLYLWYLPYGYDDRKPYDILYLMHGGGGNPDAWLDSSARKGVK